ncbi:iron complex outermembrane receptor protein [Neolewinella xylanilytica]|uniref:Iron complex outermembrane receptor protein n=1 Tax=Neolewinella xylanilytica TaxID=1514080 RepID=A0A2S6I5P4_9BACT|nr:SusC/RagA family TonB-linked outer membrane protein [Neolewinella xylanilytica]PPK86497.1 iron complex outermembrane receptor protein [Neolewinella xylanilytica]
MKLNFFHIRSGLGFVLMLLLTSATGLAQQTITGTITDAESGDPLIGASVVITGSTTGTVTDFDGNFNLSVPEAAASVTVSYTGYGSREIPLVEGQTAYDIQLTSGELLQEVVVVGYGAVKKQDLTGAVTVLSEEDFNKGVITSPEQLIQGRAAGVQVTQTSGEPGAGVNFRIRGTSSVRSNNNPLFVVDGVPLSGENTSADGNIGGLGNTSARNPLNFLNPSDIESINVLKDASATAIYGSRGANGVVIITTKSGAGGQGILTYETNIGIDQISKRYNVLGPQEFLDAYRSFNGDAATEALDGGAEVDWQDELFRTAFTQSHSLSFGGGGEDGSYRFSASYLDQEGIVEQSALQRISARFNGSKRFIDDRLGLATQVTVSDIHDDNVPITTNAGFEGDLLGNVLKANPTQPIYNPDGTFNQVSQTEPNPLALLNLYEGFTNTLRLLGNVSAEFAITDALSFKSVYGIDRSFSSRTDAQSRDQRVQGVENIGRLSLNDLQVNNDLWENYFTLNAPLGGAIDFQGLLGYSYQRFERIGKGASYANFRTSDLDIMINNVSSADQVNGTGAFGNSFRTLDELQSYFGRINFDIADKYLVTATLRADGSTRFGDGNRYGLFPSFAFKWRLLEELFAPEAFSDLGLRIGYGVTGNQEIPHNQYQRRQRYGNYGYNAGTTTIDGGGLGTVAFANPDLKWESTSQINAGIDWGFNNNRISGSIDYYYKSTNDLLIQVTSAQPAVQPFVWQNLDANVVNEGVELAINYIAVDNDNFTWDVIFNVGYNNNIVKDFDGLINTGEISGQGLTGAFAQRIANGQPLYAFFLREFGGYDAEGNSIYPEGDFQQFTGQSPLPKYTGGLTNQFGFGNFDVNLFFTGQFGFYIYNNTANAFFTAGALANGRNVSEEVVGNGEGNLNAPDVSTRFVEKGDFVRLQNASIGYTLPTGDGILSNMRLSVTGQNLFVITGYSGQDPEVSISKPINGVPSVGIDYTAYPRARTITFGLSASF